MKIYYPKIAYNKAERAYIFPLLKPFIKSGEFNDNQRYDTYAISEKDVEFVESMQEANIAILTMSWNYYLKEKKEKEALNFIRLANKAQIKVWMVMLGDVGLPIPSLQNTIVFRASGYRSKLPKWHKGLPVFITDPLKTYGNTSNPVERMYSVRPTVGFCGLASKNRWSAVRKIIKIGLKNLGYHLKLNKQTPEHIISAPYFRYQCLKPLIENIGVNNNFILRKKYRAGAISKEQREQSTIEFYENIRDSDYVLCVRGAGNFSARLFETLAMGRIPVYVNTDGLLPLQNKIDWKKHVVWVEKDEISIISEKIITFHNNLNQLKLNELFIANRNLWVNHFRMGSFFKNYFYEY